MNARWCHYNAQCAIIHKENFHTCMAANDIASYTQFYESSESRENFPLENNPLYGMILWRRYEGLFLAMPPLKPVTKLVS